MRTVHEINDLDFPVKIEQSGKRRWRVTYGAQVKTFTDWQHAFHEYSYCLAHALECAGKIDR